jgi:hypothetical protein
MMPEEKLALGAPDQDPCLIDECLHVLVFPAEKFTFDRDRPTLNRFEATLLEVYASHRLLAIVGLRLRTRPAVNPVA